MNAFEPVASTRKIGFSAREALLKHSQRVLRKPFNTLIALSCISAGIAGAAELKILDSVVVKFGSDAELVIRDNASIGKNTVFTSGKDDKTNGAITGIPQTPFSGDWRGIRIEKTVSSMQWGDSVSVFYAGGANGAGLSIRGLAPSLNFAQFSDSVTGLRLVDNASPQLKGVSVLRNGVGIETDQNSSPVISGGQFSQNTNNAIWNKTPSTVIQATDNWWGHASGPKDSVGNPQGQGDKVSTGVSYGQFMAQAPLLNPNIQLLNTGASTEQSIVALKISCLNAVEYRIAENNAFAGISFKPMAENVQYTLSADEGAKKLYVQFRSNTGNIVTTALDQNLVLDKSGPTINVTNPAEGSVITKPISITATATDAGGVSRAEFWIDGVLAASFNNAPYSYDWATSNLQQGPHQIKVVAYDNAGHKTEDIRSITYQKLVSAYTLQVNAQANIYGAGHNAAPAPGGNGAGQLSPVQVFTPGAGQVLTFTEVTGQVSCCTGSSSFNDADGGVFATGSTDVNAYAGISGIKHANKTMFLVGVFLTANEPSEPSPETVNFTNNDNFASFAPKIGQVFFIGDGLTGKGTGEIQQFNIPPTATRLFLGFADAADFKGLPGSYGDNQGSLSASFNITKPLGADAVGPVVSNLSFNSTTLTNGATLTKNGTVTALASDPSGIAKVELLFDGILAGTMSSANNGYSAGLNLDNVVNGNHTLSIRASDSLNNVSTTNLSILVSHAAPDAPTLNLQLGGSVTKIKDQVITGQAKAGSQVQLYINGVAAGAPVTAGESGNFSIAATLVAGVNQIQAKATDQYGSSILSAVLSITLDTAVPTAPTNLTAVTQAGGKIKLAWARSADQNATSVVIYRASSPFTNIGEALKIATLGATVINYDDLPVADGTYYYRVAALNNAGTPSATTNQIQAISDSQAPRASVTYFPLGKVDNASGRIGQGKVNVTLAVTEALQTVPYFAVVPNGGAPITVSLVKQDDLRYTGSFIIDSGTNAGLANVLFSARDMVGNRGTEVDAGANLQIDTEGPLLTAIALTPASPIKNDPVQTIVGTFTFSKALTSAPQIKYVLSGPVRSPVVLSGLSQLTATTYRGTFTLPNDAGLGTPETLSFSFQAQDQLDNISSKITAGNNRFQIYQGNLPPLNIPLGLTAKAQPGGKVKLVWQAVDEASSYQIYRQAPGQSGLSPLTRASGIEYMDQTPQDGSYKYAVASIRQSNSQETLSSQSAAVEVISSKTAPGAPQNLSLQLTGQGIYASWQAPLASTVDYYNFYRASGNSISSIEGLTPLKTRIKNPATYDTAPSPTQGAYVVSAVDAAGNESAISNSAYLNASLLPVRNLKVEQVGSSLPVISWTPPNGNVTGYNVYVGAEASKTKLTSAPIAANSFTDTGYTTGERRYTIASVDANGVEMPRVTVLPNVNYQVVSGLPIKRGVMNKLQVQVTNTSIFALDGTRAVVRLPVNKELTQYKDHKSDPFTLGANETRLVPVIVGGYVELPATLQMQIGVEISPNEGELVKVSKDSNANVTDGSLVIGMATDEFTRGATGKLKLTIENTTDTDIELLTAVGNGTSDSTELRFKILDSDGNVLAVQPYKQLFGANVITLTNGQTVARIPAGSNYVSDVFNLNVPASSPNSIRVKLEVDKLRYHSGEEDEVQITGRGSEKVVSLIDTAYYGEVTDVSPISSFGDQDVVINGRALDRKGQAALPNTRLKLVLNQQGFERNFSVLTDSAGNFRYTFKPTLTDSGLYRVSAVHPDITDRPEQKAFTINRVTVGPTPYKLDIPKNYPFTIPFSAKAGPGTAATNLRLRLDAASQPNGQIPAGISLQLPVPVTLAEKQTLNVPVIFNANNEAQPTGSLILNVISDEHSAAPIGQVKIDYTLSEAKPYLSSTPSFIQTGLAQGGSQIESLVVENKGLQDALNLQFSVTKPDGTPVPSWVNLASKADGTLPVGSKRTIDISFNPPAGTSEGIYEYRLAVQGDNISKQTLNIYVSLTQSGKGSVLFKASDIYTATVGKNGKMIAGLADATITIQNEDVPSIIFELVTDSIGEALFENLPAGRYTFRAKASNHQEMGGRAVIKPGITMIQPVFLDYNLITVEWSVREITIQDRYDITLNATFETDVPAAVVVMQPSSINLPKMKVGDVYYGELSLTNYGLVRADNVKQKLPQADLYFQYEFLVDIPDSLEAKQRITVPYRVIAVQSLEPTDGSASGGGCYSYSNSTTVGYSYSCANGTTSTGQSGSSWFSGSNSTCPAPGSGGVGGGGGGGGGGGWGGGFGGGGAGYQSIPGLPPCIKCDGKCCGGGGGGGGGGGDDK